MLILTRSVGEEIYIDQGRIKVKVLSDKNGFMRLGIEAPQQVEIDRKEVFIRKLMAKWTTAQ